MSSSNGFSSRKAPSSEGNLNADLCEFLMELSAYERNVTRNGFKSNAYRGAAAALSTHPVRISSGKEAAKIKGIGKKISDKIEEFLTTGKLEKLEKIRADGASAVLTELSRVSGVGPAKARQLYDEGIDSIEKLRKSAHQLNHHQQIGLKYLEEFEKRISRDEVEALEKAIRTSLKSLREPLTLTVCGSYRRGSESSGDIDILLTVESSMASSESENGRSRERGKSTTGKKLDQKIQLQRVVHQLEKDQLVTDTLSLGDTKFMGVCRLNEDHLHRRLDIRLLAPDQYYCGVLYFTGSDLFNKEMRSAALDAGFTLNEYSIRPMGCTGVPGEPLPVSSERDIFDYIGMEYKEPSERNM
ncbi:DNA polymerase beta thumb domain [Trinorchestia longiramus]|nr:DNA polymerase beta thumb domain [Trinorchestia longiramus]